MPPHHVLGFQLFSLASTLVLVQCSRGNSDFMFRSTPKQGTPTLASLNCFVSFGYKRAAVSGGKARMTKRSNHVEMALKFKKRKMKNAQGDFFVDESCVDCDICRWMDPRTFKRSGLGAVVASQPSSEEDRLAAFRAMLACPSGSIRTMRPDRLVMDALRSYPLPVDETRLPGIYQLAPTTRESMGNTPYLIVREEGNIMIDVPRYLHRTADRIENLGGVKYLIVTARDNAFGHQRWKEKFPGMIRILHRHDLATNTRVMEERLDGSGPWHLVKKGRESPEAGYATGSTARFDFGLKEQKRRAPKDKAVKIVGVPGQTRGSIAVVYSLKRQDGAEEKVGFSGGAVGYSSYLKRLDSFPKTMEMAKEYQATSLTRLSKEGITSLLPGRGGRVLYQSADESTEELKRAAERALEDPSPASHPFLNMQPFI